MVEWIVIYIFYAVMPVVVTIDCYHCTSQNGDHQECNDTFVSDVTTYDLIKRNCYYGYWKALFCVKLDGIRADGSTIIVWQCTFKDWGSHCGLIQFEVANGLEDIQGCLESCNYDGCNLAPTNNYGVFLLCFTCIISLIASLVR